MLRRDQDGYLMEQFYMQPALKGHWAAINRYRLYHKLLTLSDLITGGGINYETIFGRVSLALNKTIGRIGRAKVDPHNRTGEHGSKVSFRPLGAGRRIVLFIHHFGKVKEM